MSCKPEQLGGSRLKDYANFGQTMYNTVLRLCFLLYNFGKVVDPYNVKLNTNFIHLIFNLISSTVDVP